MAFYTEVAQLETVRSISVCRILVVPRGAYNSIAAAFPIGARTVLTNLLERSHEVTPLISRASVTVGRGFDQVLFGGFCGR